MIVRNAVLSDAEALATIEKECISHPWSIVLFNADLKNPNAVYFVAEEEGRVLGFLGAHDIVGEINITNVAVKPECQRKGIANQLMKALLSEVESRAKEKEIIGITLEVRKSNEPAIKLYEKHGFVSEGIRRGYYSDGEDAIIMWKRYGTSNS